MFYGGIAGIALTLVVLAVVGTMLGKSRKGIIIQLNERYGGDIK